MAEIRRKWRPRLGQVVLGVLLAVLAVDAAIVFGFRVFDQADAHMGWVELGALALATVLTLGIGLVLGRTLTGPIEDLVGLAQAIAHGGRAAIVAPPRQGTEEVARLTESLMALATRLVDRNDYLAGFAAHVSHELKSPLTAIRGAAELLRDNEMSPAERQRFLDQIIADSARLARLLDRLRELARAEGDQPEGTTTLAQMLPLLAARSTGVAVSLMGGEGLRLPLAQESAAIVFGYLVDNAAEQGAKTIALAATVADGEVLVSVADDGPGVSPGNRARIFEPFFTTRREGGGTGLGLGIVRALLGTAGGTIVLLPDAPGEGARFEVRLPNEA
jgi:two-component system OmpR family sensor kinase